MDHCLAHFFKTLPAFFFSQVAGSSLEHGKRAVDHCLAHFFLNSSRIFLVKSPVLHANTHNDDDSLALQSLDIVPTLALQSRDIMPTTPLHHQGA